MEHLAFPSGGGGASQEGHALEDTVKRLREMEGIVAEMIRADAPEEVVAHCRRLRPTPLDLDRLEYLRKTIELSGQNAASLTPDYVWIMFGRNVRTAVCPANMCKARYELGVVASLCGLLEPVLSDLGVRTKGDVVRCLDRICRVLEGEAVSAAGLRFVVGEPNWDSRAAIRRSLGYLVPGYGGYGSF